MLVVMGCCILFPISIHTPRDLNSFLKIILSARHERKKKMVQEKSFDESRIIPSF